MVNKVQREIVGLFSEHSLYVKKQRVTFETLEKSADDLHAIVDTAKFVQEFRNKIGDKHSFVVSRIETMDQRGDQIHDFNFESQISDGLASFVIPAVFGDEKLYEKYASELLSTIKDLANGKPKKWSIDLRENWGGNLWPMLAGLYSFFPEQSVIGSFRYTDGKTDEWHYNSHGIFSGTKLMHPVSERIQNLIDIPIEVLLGKETGSSGEAVAIAFKSRQNTSFAGEKTSGLTTGNEEFVLNDGSSLFLCTCEMADSAGKTYPEGVVPDKAGDN